MTGQDLSDLSSPADPPFTLDERLFLAIEPTEYQKLVVRADQVLHHQVSFPVFSVNREAHSTPQSVLEGKRARWGVVAFRVGDIPERRCTTQEKVVRCYVFFPRHEPEHGNYAHVHVYSKCDPGEGKDKPPHEIKLYFRNHLAERVQLLIEPETLPG